MCIVLNEECVICFSFYSSFICKFLFIPIEWIIVISDSEAGRHKQTEPTHLWILFRHYLTRYVCVRSNMNVAATSAAYVSCRRGHCRRLCLLHALQMFSIFILFFFLSYRYYTICESRTTCQSGLTSGCTTCPWIWTTTVLWTTWISTAARPKTFGRNLTSGCPPISPTMKNSAKYGIRTGVLVRRFSWTRVQWPEKSVIMTACGLVIVWA